jgi:sugar phosphate isomerase/epimerase
MCLALPWARVLGAEPASKLGVAYPSYSIHAKAERDFAEPLRYLEFCHTRGAGGIQLPLGSDVEAARKLRARAAKLEMFVEGSIRPPKDKSDVERFDAEVRAAREAGATVLRSVLLGGRRYEVFKTAAEFADFKKQAVASLELAAAVLARHQSKLAIENHKDFRAAELADILRKLASAHVGVCVDTGNNLALLEDVADTVKVLAPFALACHLKDMAVERADDGFLLSEVPLGSGLLDLKSIVADLRKARADLRFSLEMITRDPLRIPCLTEGYWATFEDVPGRDLARTLAWVQKHARALPRVSKLESKKQLEAEDGNVRASIAYARDQLAL